MKFYTFPALKIGATKVKKKTFESNHFISTMLQKNRKKGYFYGFDMSLGYSDESSRRQRRTFVMLMISSWPKITLIVTNIRNRNCHERLSPREKDGLAPIHKSLRHPKDQTSGTKLCSQPSVFRFQKGRAQILKGAGKISVTNSGGKLQIKF